MGQAKKRGTFEERVDQALKAGRVKNHVSTKKVVAEAVSTKVPVASRGHRTHNIVKVKIPRGF